MKSDKVIATYRRLRELSSMNWLGWKDSNLRMAGSKPAVNHE
jgi:hypothetical protein